jgi:hypothetical protein
MNFAENRWVHHEDLIVGKVGLVSKRGPLWVLQLEISYVTYDNDRALHSNSCVDDWHIDRDVFYFTVDFSEAPQGLAYFFVIENDLPIPSPSDSWRKI